MVIKLPEQLEEEKRKEGRKEGKREGRKEGFSLCHSQESVLTKDHVKYPTSTVEN